jgi:hypothetical protein
MALNSKLGVAYRNSALNTILANLNSGFIRIYDGTQPTDADTAITTQNKLSELTFSSTAFASASGGVATANAINDDPAAVATGTATWFRCLESNGTTVIMDGSIGTSGCNLNLNTTSIVASARVSITSMTVTMGA